MLNPLDLTGRRYLVTGASSGIGQATAVCLSQLGAHVLVAGRDAERLTATHQLLSGTGHVCVAADLTDAEALPGWLKQLAADHGLLDGLVHSAGAHAMRPVRFQSSEQFEQLQRINVTAAVALAKGFRQKHVRAPRGSLVFVASVMGLVAQPGVSAYCASKGALLSLTRALALELASEQIRVNAVAPGQVLTEMTLRQKESLPAEQFAAIERMHPLGLGSPEDVAAGIAFLLSDASKWITGTTLTIDGGYTAA